MELPRHVKKPGQWLLVNTQVELDAALKDGWVLRLDPSAVVAEEPLGEAPETPEPAESDDADGTVSEPDPAEHVEQEKKKRGRPKKGG